MKKMKPHILLTLLVFLAFGCQGERGNVKQMKIQAKQLIYDGKTYQSISQYSDHSASLVGGVEEYTVRCYALTFLH